MKLKTGLRVIRNKIKSSHLIRSVFQLMVFALPNSTRATITISIIQQKSQQDLVSSFGKGIQF